MPIYEYQSSGEFEEGCQKCREPFEVLQGIGEESLKTCPSCGAAVRKLISWCRSAVIDSSPESGRVERKVKEYENSGMWSHAAELADTHAEKVKDESLRTRALDNYKKAGYDVDSLAKHAENSNK
jgi:putative FmdB family regulatory protein